VNTAQVQVLVENRTVLVTGAGGSIGGELCRQLAGLETGRLVLVGHGENSIFEIFHELRTSFPSIVIFPVIADVRDAQRIREVMEEYRPHVVFHAAAHKHVPLMESNPVEAVTNNVIGTKNVVDASIASGVERFVLVSTDKAVRPTSVMGASKRIAEQVVQRAASEHGRNFVCVRFGNVLGSRGSVVPTFMRQIRTGGPVVVTHPDMQRFFMTIPEAVQLVMQAGAIGRGGELFVLDMGEPIRIADLAADLIGLCGLEVGRDIEIRYSGMRPGEKLYEEVFFDEKSAVPSKHPKILYSKDVAPVTAFSNKLAGLINAAEIGAPSESLLKLMRNLVPDFQHSSFQAPPDAADNGRHPVTMGDADDITVTGERRIVS
jgi:FlaA1/EpsC-like NDP-sugar epimerase